MSLLFEKLLHLFCVQQNVFYRSNGRPKYEHTHTNTNEIQNYNPKRFQPRENNDPLAASAKPTTPKTAAAAVRHSPWAYAYFVTPIAIFSDTSLMLLSGG